jgi:hypothetical protein
MKSQQAISNHCAVVSRSHVVATEGRAFQKNEAKIPTHLRPSARTSLAPGAKTSFDLWFRTVLPFGTRPSAVSLFLGISSRAPLWMSTGRMSTVLTARERQEQQWQLRPPTQVSLFPQKRTQKYSWGHVLINHPSPYRYSQKPPSSVPSLEQASAALVSESSPCFSFRRLLPNNLRPSTLLKDRLARPLPLLSPTVLARLRLCERACRLLPVSPANLPHLQTHLRRRTRRERFRNKTTPNTQTRRSRRRRRRRIRSENCTRSARAQDWLWQDSLSKLRQANVSLPFF